MGFPNRQDVRDSGGSTTSAQDLQGSRTPADLERRYTFGKSFADIMNIATDAQTHAYQAEETVERIEKEFLNLDVVNELNVAAGTITLKSGGLVIESNGFSLSEEEGIVATKGVIGGCTFEDGKLIVPVSCLSGEIGATQINAEGLTVNLLSAIGEYGTVEIRNGRVYSSGDCGETIIQQGQVILLDAFDHSQLTLSNQALMLIDENGYIAYEMENGRGKITAINGMTFDGMALAEYGYTFDVYTHFYYPAQFYDSAHFNDNVYGENASFQFKSDRNAKNSIEDLPDAYEVVFDNLRPVIHKYNNGTSDRYHTAFIAQEVDEAREKAGIPRKDFAAVCIDNEGLDTEKWYLRYIEFIPILVKEIQKLKSRVAELQKTGEVTNE